MKYKTESSGGGIMLEKYTEPKGFFRNTTGQLKIGEITLDDGTEEMLIHDFLFEDGYYDVYYMELGSVKGLDFPYRGEAPQISIGDKKHNIPVEDRIKFMYESLSYNTNYNYLGIISTNPVLGVRLLSFKIIKWDFQFEDSIAFFIKELKKYGI